MRKQNRPALRVYQRNQGGKYTFSFLADSNKDKSGHRHRRVIAKAVSISETETRAVGEKILSCWLNGEITDEQITPDYIKQVLSQIQASSPELSTSNTTLPEEEYLGLTLPFFGEDTLAETDNAKAPVSDEPKAQGQDTSAEEPTPQQEKNDDTDTTMQDTVKASEPPTEMPTDDKPAATGKPIEGTAQPPEPQADSTTVQASQPKTSKQPQAIPTATSKTTALMQSARPLRVEKVEPYYLKLYFSAGKLLGLDTVDMALYGAIQYLENVPPQKGGKGYCYASMEKLGAMTLVRSDKTVREHLRKLVKKGLVKNNSRGVHTRLNTVNICSLAVKTTVKVDSTLKVNFTELHGKNYREYTVNSTDNKEEIEDLIESREVPSNTLTSQTSEKKQARKKKKFVPPTLEEIKAYITEKGYHVDAGYFYDYYSTGGWRDSKGNPVKSWKQKLVQWSRHEKPNTSPSQPAELTPAQREARDEARRKEKGIL